MHKQHQRLIAALISVGICSLLAGVAVAQEDFRVGGQSGGMDTHLFRPAVDSKGFITMNGSNILGDKDFSFGLVLDYGRNLLRTSNSDQAVTPGGEPCRSGRCLDEMGNEVGNVGGIGASSLIENSLQGTFAFSYGLGNLAVVGVQVPIILMTADPAYGIGQPGGATYNAVALDEQSASNVSLHGKIRLTRVEKTVGLALLAQVGLPLGDAAQNLGADPGFWYWPQAILEHRLGATGSFRLGLNVGFRGNTGEGAAFSGDTLIEGDVRHGNLGTFSAGFAWRVVPAMELIGETYGSFLLDSASAAEQKLSQEISGALKVFVEKNSYFLIGGGHRTFSTGYQAADLRMFVGFVFEPSIGDRDGDGYKDDEDQCPDEPEDFDSFEDDDGCPDPDNDKDGILDVDDRCPNIPEDMDGDQDEDGCPEGGDGDRDGDGILDSNDKCPDEPEDRDGFEDEDGCPDPDNDKDGILDVDDECPLDPEDKDGFEDEDGCPDPDNDQDQILDVDDQCPNDPETYNGLDDEDGCPDKGRVVLDGSDILILDKILFATNSSEILEQSFPILNAVATTLHHHPEFLVVEVAGHADERASDRHNLKLTKARAKSVVVALTSRGIDRSRLVSQGYGEFCPVETASNARAWEKNRRVEFKVVKTEDGITGAERGCQRAQRRGVFPPRVQADGF